MFFQGKNPVHRTIAPGRPPAGEGRHPLRGGGRMAVNAHQYQRTTADVDLLLPPMAWQRPPAVRGKELCPRTGSPGAFVDRTSGT